MIIQTIKTAALRTARLPLFSQSLISRQAFSVTATRFSKAYDHDGKTRVSIFNTETNNGLMVTGYSQYGFRLNNDMVLIGPISVFPRSVLSWNVNSFEDINEQSLSLFPTLEPKIDILVIGIGDQAPTASLSKRVIEFMKKYKINVEVLRTEQACATFNFLNAEGRMVACALIPPVHISYNENDVLQTKLRHKQLYETD
ncbi:NADH dehydrogenase [ubiquinone] 1 alpha subcomplex assembly factor 3 [Drosophila nasuta]|uniref:NADH dehydrogenase [ubiquinone] 1 alpha subcomplex assembly factor 3 n=1 Tax=Drosophila albomicans TaxID=7291 RepID=A0A6P8WZC5_DROAB|nr:NADH dehydrogenase [ubiquinone] 1 alpha subcomplex assembly factor 3 [Drosophila albomicans]XP_060651348.1 NADH dehydrogenase [ubiquinone] 1 alpha subcomplex assembly factor 3 [Drosophila nasuta]